MQPGGEKDTSWQWERLPRVSKCAEALGPEPFSVGQRYPEKNRYTDILPFNSTRVLLEPSEDNKDGYVNANYVKLPHSTVIATQAPVPSSIEDFWQMIWEKKSKMIIMLTRLKEKNQIKANCYWPKVENEPQLFGRFLITLRRIRFYDTHIIHTLYMEEEGKANRRKIHHLQFTAWPDYGVPDSADSMLELLEVISKYEERRTKTKPIESADAPIINTVVHCSAGIGRCGTLLAIKTALDRFNNGEDSEKIGVFDIVSELRHQRVGMVQSKAQYEFIFEVLNSFYKTKPLTMSDGVTQLEARSKPRRPSKLGKTARPATVRSGSGKTQRISKTILRLSHSTDSELYKSK